MGAASFSFYRRLLTAPRRIYGLGAALPYTRAVVPRSWWRTLSPVASARVGSGSALHSALTPMTPHERDPFAGRSKADHTPARNPRG